MVYFEHVVSNALFLRCRGGAMVTRTTCNLLVASSSLACVTFVFFFWQGRLVHMPMNTASRGLSVFSKMPHLLRCVSTGNALSFFHVVIER